MLVTSPSSSTKMFYPFSHHPTKVKEPKPTGLFGRIICFPSSMCRFTLKRYFSHQSEPFNLSDWTHFYYKNPSPETVITGIHSMISEDHFKKDYIILPAIGFLAGVMTQHPDHIDEWLSKLSSLDKEDLYVVHKAIEFSNVTLGDDIIQKHALNLEKRPLVYHLEITRAEILDMNWGYFFATGDKNPIRHIIHAFNYTDDQNLMKKMISVVASWSLEQNCKEHPLIVEHCRSICQTETLTPNELSELRKVLEKV